MQENTNLYAWEIADIQRRKSLCFGRIVYPTCQVMSVPKLAVGQPNDR